MRVAYAERNGEKTEGETAPTLRACLNDISLTQLLPRLTNKGIDGLD